MDYLGDFPVNGTVQYPFLSTSEIQQQSTASALTLTVYKNASITERTSAAGITLTASFDGISGSNHCTIDLSDNTDAGFWAAGNEYKCIGTMTVNFVTSVLWGFQFSIERAGGALALIKLIKANTDNLPSAVKKNTARRLHFYMVLASDHVTPATGLTVAATRALDGAVVFTAATGAVTEVASGWYFIDAAAGDLNGDTVAWKMTAATADPCSFSILTEP